MEPQERQETVNWMGAILQNLNRQEALWNRRQFLTQQFQPMTPPKQPWGYGHVALAALGIAIVAGLPLLVIVELIGSFPPLALLIRSLPDPVRFVTTSLIAILTPPAAGTVAGIFIRRHVNRKSIPQTNQRIAANNEVREAQNRQVAQQIEATDRELQQVRQQLGGIIAGRFPERYLHIEAVGFCLRMIQDMRADTVGQAINLYEEQLRHNDQMAAQQRIVEETQQVRRQVMVGTVVNSAMQGAAMGLANNHAKQARANADGNTAVIVDAIKGRKRQWF